MTTPDDLVERVAQMCCEELTASEADVAKIAYNLALEEAAKVARPPSHMLGSADPYANGYRAACADINAAIRAMIKD